MKKLLALTLVAGTAIGMASMTTACGPKTAEETQYFLGHGNKRTTDGTITSRVQNEYYNVIKVEVKVEGDKIVTANLSESNKYIAATSANGITIQDSAKAKFADVTAATWYTSKSATYGQYSYDAAFTAYKAISGNDAKTDDEFKASAEATAALTEFNKTYQAGESARYVYDLVSVPADKIANIQTSPTDANKVGFIAKDETTYPGFKFDLLKTSVEALFTDKNCSDVKDYKFDTRIKKVASIPTNDTAIAGATASETTLYAAAMLKATKTACGL